MVTITSSRLLANSCGVASSRKMGTTKTRGMILAAQSEVRSSRRTWLPKEGEPGHWQERISVA